MANEDKKILVVEDEENLSMLIEYNLNKVGYKSIIASDGEQAMDRLKESKFDLVIFLVKHNKFAKLNIKSKRILDYRY